MSQTVEIGAVRQRREHVRREVENLRLILAAREQEGERLDVTLSELERFVDGGELAPDDGPDLSARMIVPETSDDARPVETPAGARVGRKKPEGLPTLREMVMDVLRAEPLDSPGLEPKEITAKVRERWWRDAPNDSVGPTASRMATETKELDRRGGKYFIRRDADAGTLPFGEPKTVADMAAVGEA